MVAILEFRSARFSQCLIYKSPWWFLASLESTGLSVQVKKRKKDFQDGGHLGVPIGTILSIFDLQVTLMVPSKFGVNWPFGSGEEAKNRFSRWRPWRPFWISDRNDFSYFWSTSHSDASYQVSSQLAQGCRRSRLLKQLLTPHDGRRTLTDHNSSPWARSAHCELKIYFQDGCHGGHRGYPIGTIFAIFHLQVTPVSPNKFGVSWPFGAEETAKYRFSRSPPWWPSGISDQKDFSCFWSTSHRNASY